MAVWTIAAHEGTGGGPVAAAGVPRLDRKALALLAHDPEPVADEVGELEERIGGRLDMLALSMAIVGGSPDAVRDLRLIQRLPEVGRALMAEAARQACVIFAPGAFAASARHSSAIHVRLHAPFA
jgi:hypothetical protein